MFLFFAPGPGNVMYGPVSYNYGANNSEAEKNKKHEENIIRMLAYNGFLNYFFGMTQNPKQAKQNTLIHVLQIPMNSVTYVVSFSFVVFGVPTCDVWSLTAGLQPAPNHRIPEPTNQKKIINMSWFTMKFVKNVVFSLVF